MVTGLERSSNVLLCVREDRPLISSELYALVLGRWERLLFHSGLILMFSFDGTAVWHRGCIIFIRAIFNTGEGEGSRKAQVALALPPSSQPSCAFHRRPRHSYSES